jgi:hypothetical protein
LYSAGKRPARVRSANWRMLMATTWKSCCETSIPSGSDCLVLSKTLVRLTSFYLFNCRNIAPNATDYSIQTMAVTPKGGIAMPVADAFGRRLYKLFVRSTIIQGLWPCLFQEHHRCSIIVDITRHNKYHRSNYLSSTGRNCSMDRNRKKLF